MNDINNEPAYSKQVIEFLTVANEFCLTVENIEKIDAKTFKSITQKMLPLLYVKGSLLPTVIPVDPEALTRFVNEEQWESIYKTLKGVFKNEDSFLHLDKESSFEPRIVQLSVAELLTDIYQDMKDFVLLYQQERRVSKQCAVQEALKLFATNWGKKSTIALQALHEMNYKNLEEKSNNFLDFLDD